MRVVLVVAAAAVLMNCLCQGVVVSKSSVEKAQAEAAKETQTKPEEEVVEDSKEAASSSSDSRVGISPYQFQEDHHGVEIAHSVDVPNDGAVHMTPGAAAQLAEQFHRQAAAAQAVSDSGLHHHHHHLPRPHVPSQDSSLGKNGVQYVTFQYPSPHYENSAEEERRHTGDDHRTGSTNHHQNHAHPHPPPHFPGFPGVPLPVHGLGASHDIAAHAHVDALANQLQHEVALHEAHHHHEHEHGHGLQSHHHGPHHHQAHGAVQLRKVLVPLAGIALLGAAAALATNPVLLQLGVVSGAAGKRRRRSASATVMEHRSMPDDDEDYMTSGEDQEQQDDMPVPRGANVDNMFANYTKDPTQAENDVNLRLKEIMVLETFLKAQAQEPERRSGPQGSADGALASLLTCSGLLNPHSALCLQRMACEAHSDETDLPALELSVIKIVLRELLEHDGIPRQVKRRLQSAVVAGSKGHRCEAIYRCPAKAWSRCTDPNGEQHQPAPEDFSAVDKP